jgi:hypothetical protein
MASQKGSPSHSLSGYSANELDKLRTYKPTKWYKNLLSQSQHKALYNEKLLTQEYEPDPNWKMPKVPASEIYNLSVFQFKAATLIRYCSVNIPISLGQSKYQLPLIQQEDIEWGLKHGFEYIHIGLIQFGLNALVHPGLNTHALLCIIDSRHNNFQDAMISGFQAPLHNGPVWSSALPRFQVSLRDPYINTLLQAYLKLVGFDMAEGSKVAQIHSTICLRFVTSTMPALNPKLQQRAINESVVVGPGNVSPLSLGFCKLTEIEEWSAEYDPISTQFQPPMPKEMTVYMNSQGQPTLRLGKSQSQKYPSLDRQFSSLSTSTSRSDPPRHSNVHMSPVSSPPRTPLYKPVLGRSKLDNHFIQHREKGSRNCYYCKRDEYDPKKLIPCDETSAPSMPNFFETYQQKSEHLGQHSDCRECAALVVPTIKMMDYPLPRAGRDKKSEIPIRSLGTGNHTPRFQNNLVADLDFIQYRKPDDPIPQENIRLQNYANYQSVCLAQNIDDIAQDVLKTKGHMNGLHSDLEQVTQNQNDMKQQLDTILEKLQIIQDVVNNMQKTVEEESQPSSPEMPTNDASFSFFKPSSPPERKYLTFKRIDSSIPNPVLIRVSQILQLAHEKLKLVKSQGMELENQIQQAKEESLAKQLAIISIQSPHLSSCIKMVDVKPEQPESSHQNTNRTPTWEQWCNARYSSGKKAAMDIDGQGQTSIKQGDTAPVSNIDCKERNDIEVMIQGWHAWAKTQKMLYKDKVSWSDLALRITWGFRGNLSFWWERVADHSKLQVIQHDKPIDELCKAVVHEFYGDVRVNMSHYADTFMSQKLCDLKDLRKYFCTMQSLLYKVPDPRNTAYLRKYLSSLPNPVPELTRKRLADEDIEMETLSLAGLHEQVIIAIQEECNRRKHAKSMKKHLGLASSACELFEETSSYGCFKPKHKSHKTTNESSCHCKTKSFKKSRGFKPKKKILFKKRQYPRKPRHSSCFICKKPGHWVSQCPLRSKTKTQVKMMTMFQTIYEPQDWDLVSHRSEGEYFSLSEDSSDDEGGSSPTLLSDSDTASSEPEQINFLDIKMFMSSFVDLESLHRQRDALQAKLSVLSPGQFFLYDYYSSQLEQVQEQIRSLQ